MDATITATFRAATGTLLEEQPLDSFALFQPDELRPVRKPVSYKGQSHLPGYFWMSTLNRLVSYESRLEMVILKQLDFDPTVSEVLPQPCVLHFSVDRKAYRHIPDYLVWRTDADPQVINVKPRQYVEKERNQRAFSASRIACARIGWTYETRSEPPATVLANLNWLAGFRRPPPNVDQYAQVLIERAAEPLSIRALIAGVGLPALVRPVLFYLLWTHQLNFELQHVLSDMSVVSRPG